MGKRKIAIASETPETLTPEVLEASPEQPAQEPVMVAVEQIVPETPSEPAKKPEPPTIYGVTPTTQEIEAFREKYLAWLRQQ